MSGVSSELERRFSVLAHASALLGLLLPFGQLLGPYVARLLMPPQATHARQQALEALNFQLNVVVVVAILLAALLYLHGGWWYFVLFVPNLYGFGMALWGATGASHGHTVRYPLVLRVFGSPTDRRSAA